MYPGAGQTSRVANGYLSMHVEEFYHVHPLQHVEEFYHVHPLQFKAQWSLYVPHGGHYMYRQFNIQQFYVLPAQSVYVFCVDLRTNRLIPYRALTGWFL